MKSLYLKHILFNHNSLKIISLLLGYSFWYIATFNQHITITCKIPLCFNNDNNYYSIDAPESVEVTLQGKRSDLYKLDKNTLAAHITIKNLLPGKNGILLCNQNLFLPKSISLASYNPMNLSIIINEKTQKEYKC